MRARLVAAAALAALAAGGFCIWLGRSVLAEPPQLASARASLAAPGPAAPALGGGGVAASLLGTGGERQALAAASDAVRARSLAGAERAERELGRLAASGPGGRRSWAATLVASFELEQAQLGGAGAAKHVATAVAALRNAVAADPANEDAKRNLELLLRLRESDRSSHRHQPRKQGARPPTHARPQAGLTPPGWGW